MQPVLEKKQNSLLIQSHLRTLEEVARQVELSRRMFTQMFTWLLDHNEPADSAGYLLAAERALKGTLAKKTRQLVVDVQSQHNEFVSLIKADTLLAEHLKNGIGGLLTHQQDFKVSQVADLWRNVEKDFTTTRLVTVPAAVEVDPSALVIKQHDKMTSVGPIILIKEDGFKFLEHKGDFEPKVGWDSPNKISFSPDKTKLVLEFSTKRDPPLRFEVADTALIGSFMKDFEKIQDRIKAQTQPKSFQRQAATVAKLSRLVAQEYFDLDTLAIGYVASTSQNFELRLSIKAKDGTEQKSAVLWKAVKTAFPNVNSIVPQLRVQPDFNPFQKGFARINFSLAISRSDDRRERTAPNQYPISVIQLNSETMETLSAPSGAYEMSHLDLRDQGEYKEPYIEEFAVHNETGVIYISDLNKDAGDKYLHAIVVFKLRKMDKKIVNTDPKVLKCYTFPLDKETGDFNFLRAVSPSRTMTVGTEAKDRFGVFIAAFANRLVVIHTEPVLTTNTSAAVEDNPSDLGGRIAGHHISDWKCVSTNIPITSEMTPSLRYWNKTCKQCFLSADGYLKVPLYKLDQ